MWSVAQLLFACSAVIVLFMGSVHLWLTFRSRRFEPADADLLVRLQQITPRITRQTTYWRAAQGFHASHSLGAMLFGSVYLCLALGEPGLPHSTALASLGLLYLLLMTWLAWRYWFRIPLLGISVSLLAYSGGWLSSVLA